MYKENEKLIFKEDVHQYFFEDKEVPCVSYIIEQAQLVDFSFVSDYILSEAAKFGRAVHLATDYYDKKILDEKSLNTALVPYLDQWKKAVQEMDITIETSELPLYSKKYGYAGTLDKLCTIDNQLFLIDIKTSNRLYPFVKIQTAAYLLLVEENFKKKPIRIIMQIEEKTYKITKLMKSEDALDKSLFLSALQLYKWRKNNNLIKKEQNT